MKFLLPKAEENGIVTVHQNRRRDRNSRRLSICPCSVSEDTEKENKIMAEKENYGYEEDDILTLEFDDGTEEECGILGVFDALGKEYIALNPLGTDDVYLYGYKEYEDDYELLDITDEEEFKKVVAEFEALAVEEA